MLHCVVCIDAPQNTENGIIMNEDISTSTSRCRRRFIETPIFLVYISFQRIGVWWLDRLFNAICFVVWLSIKLLINLKQHSIEVGRATFHRSINVSIQMYGLFALPTHAPKLIAIVASRPWLRPIYLIMGWSVAVWGEKIFCKDTLYIVCDSLRIPFGIKMLRLIPSNWRCSWGHGAFKAV